MPLVQLFWPPKVILGNTKNIKIEGLEHEISGTKYSTLELNLKNGSIYTNGGRVLGVTALGVNLQVAQAKAYDRANQVSWEGKIKRHDIGEKEIRGKFIFS